MALPRHRKVIATSERATIRARLIEGVGELRESLSDWRVWHLMGSADIRKRFARSRIGQLWIILTTAITFSAMATMWSLLWRVPLAEMLPYVAWSFVIWLLINGIIQDNTSALAEAKGYLINQYMPPMNIVLSIVYRNVLIFLMNATIPMAISIWLGIWPGLGLLVVILGLSVAVIFSVSLATIVAIVCTRFRDVVQIILAGMQVFFYLTPILWKPEQLPLSVRPFIMLNPFAAIMSLIRDPLLQREVPTEAILVAAGSTILAVAIALILLGTYRRRLIYWL